MLIRTLYYIKLNIYKYQINNTMIQNSNYNAVQEKAHWANKVNE